MNLKKIIAGVTLSTLMLVATTGAAFADSTVVVTENDLDSVKLDAYTNGTWFLYNDVTDEIDNAQGTFVMGPDTPPAGDGSVQISTINSERPNIATYQFHGTKLSDITTLKYSTYNPSAGNGGSADRAGYLQFNVDFNQSDSWQSRLVFVPRNNGTVVQDSWQEWDAINGGNAMWSYSGATWPVTGEPGTTLKTWNQILIDYPDVRMRVTDSFLGIRVGEPYADGYTENIDAFKFGTANGVTTFDFDPYVEPTDDEGDDCDHGHGQDHENHGKGGDHDKGHQNQNEHGDKDHGKKVGWSKQDDRHDSWFPQWNRR